MFENAGVKTVTIIVDEKNMQYGMYLQGLIGQRDDEEDKIIGIKDGSVKTAVWTESQYEQNRPTITSEQEIIFVGDSKPARVIAKNIEVKYDFLGMKYGWLGNMAYITAVDKKMTEDEYKKFIVASEKEAKAVQKEKEKRNKLGIAVGAAGTVAATVLNPVAALAGAGGALVGGVTSKILNDKQKKEKMHEECFKYALNHFYLHALQEFLEE